MRPNLEIHFAVYQQQGMGLIEVLVALLLFSSAALGYAAIQVRSLSSTDESMMRLQALMLLKETTERMRANGPLQDLSLYQVQLNAVQPTAVTDCLSSKGCNRQQRVKNDVAKLKYRAKALGLSLGLVDCPTADDRESKCLIAAWNHTTAGYESGDDLTTGQSIGCLKANGNYVKEADCVSIVSLP